MVNRDALARYVEAGLLWCGAMMYIYLAPFTKVRVDRLTAFA